MKDVTGPNDWILLRTAVDSARVTGDGDMRTLAVRFVRAILATDMIEALKKKTFAVDGVDGVDATSMHWPQQNQKLERSLRAPRHDIQNRPHSRR